MNKMITLNLGPRNCGKSLRVEQKMSVYENKYYLGTLKVSEQYAATITRHKARRDQSWTLFEVSDNFENDIKTLGTALSKRTKIDAVILDGIITWFLNVHEKENISAERFVRRLVGLIENSNRDWFLVDVNAELFELSGLDWKKLQFIHKELIDKLNIKSITDWNYE